MSIKVTNSATLKATPNPQNQPQLVPLTIFDRVAINLHVPTLYAFHPPTPTNESLKSGLTRVLSYFPHLSGRISTVQNTRPCILLNNAGIRVIETQVDSTLSEMLPLDATTNLGRLHPDISEGVEEVFQVQLNRYACGGLVIGSTSHHRVADGRAMSMFYSAWAQMVRVGKGPDPLPFLDRNAVVGPRNPPSCEFNHRAIEFGSPGSATSVTQTPNIENLKIRFSADFISKLKSAGPARCTTFEALLAHLWRKISLARALKPAQQTKVIISVNGRPRLKSSSTIPLNNFFGNLVLSARPKTTAGDLTGNRLSHAVEIIREAVGKIDDRYFRSFIDFGELEKDKEILAPAPAAGHVHCPNLEVDSWLGFSFQDLDFGSGTPCCFIPPNYPVEGQMVFVPWNKEKGGVEVFMTLAEEHVEKFKMICYCLD